MGVSKISHEELSAARGQIDPYFSVPSEKTQKYSQNPNKKRYFERLYEDPKNPIAVFFTGGSDGKLGNNPLGYKEHLLDNYLGEDFVVVLLQDYMIFFNDYTTYVLELPEQSDAAKALSEYAKNTGTTVSTLFDKEISTKLFGSKFPETYTGNRAKFFKNNQAAEEKKLPDDIKTFFSNALKIEKERIDLDRFYSLYGTGNPEAIIDSGLIRK